MKRNRRRGTAVVEAALMMPWIAFLFVGVLDFGFYAYAAICTQNAARAVAVTQATGSGAGICTVALGELSGLPNMVGVTSCGTYPGDITSTKPAAVCVATLTKSGSSDTTCSSATKCADCDLNASSTSVVAQVTYQTLPMVPIPGVLMGQMTLSRTAEMRVIQ